MVNQTLQELLAATAEDDVLFDWEVRHNVEVSAVRAWSMDSFRSRALAMEAAEDLLTQVLGLGYELVNRAEIKVATQMPEFGQWRGGIDVVLTPVIPRPAR